LTAVEYGTAAKERSDKLAFEHRAGEVQENLPSVPEIQNRTRTADRTASRISIHTN
jgi:hypothetical protein